MTTLVEVLQFFKYRATSQCDTSEDGSMEKYFKGASDAYKECATVLERHIAQAFMPMAAIMPNQTEAMAMSIDEAARSYSYNRSLQSHYRYDRRSVEDGYIQGALEQKAIDNEQYNKDMAYVNIKRQEFFDRVFDWIRENVEHYKECDFIHTDALIADMRKEMGM